VWSRIDRFLVSPDWEARFPVSSQKRLPHLYSDHFPILLDCGDFSRGNRSFKFDNMWLKAEGFVGKVIGGILTRFKVLLVLPLLVN
jgi:hypothetical protein